MIELRAGEASAEGIAHVVALLTGVFPTAHHLDPTWLSWDYLANPLGRSLVAQAFVEGRLVAHLAGRFLRARFGGTQVRGILVHHAATHPGFRRRGLLVRSIEALLARAAAAGAAFAVAVVNRKSARAFVGAGGFANLRPLSARLALGGLRLRDVADPALDFAPLHHPTWLAWRLAAPAARYRARRREGIAEIWADPGPLGVPVLLGTVPAEGPALRLPTFAPRSPLRLWVGCGAGRRLAAPFSLELPLALRPSPLHLVFHPLGTNTGVPAPDRLRFDALDFDAW